jgi:hypothetical protein
VRVVLDARASRDGMWRVMMLSALSWICTPRSGSSRTIVLSVHAMSGGCPSRSCSLNTDMYCCASPVRLHIPIFDMIEWNRLFVCITFNFGSSASVNYVGCVLGIVLLWAGHS